MGLHHLVAMRDFPSTYPSRTLSETSLPVRLDRQEMRRLIALAQRLAQYLQSAKLIKARRSSICDIVNGKIIVVPTARFFGWMN